MDCTISDVVTTFTFMLVHQNPRPVSLQRKRAFPTVIGLCRGVLCCKQEPASSHPMVVITGSQGGVWNIAPYDEQHACDGSLDFQKTAGSVVLDFSIQCQG